MPVVTGIDVLGIQGYVFASHRVRDVLAASWMVDRIVKRSDDSLAQWGVTSDRVLLAAGGNAIIEFGTLDEARVWTRQYTRWLYEEAPGIEVVVAHRAYDGRSLAWALKALAIDLARSKFERCPSAPQLGLGVTAACSVTGLPATSLDRYDQVPVSRHIEVLRRPEVLRCAKERWERYLPGPLERAPGWRADFPLELDLMGRSHGETSLVGVVHVDGNSVGTTIGDWLEHCLEEELGDERVRAEYGEWSRAISELGERVLRATVRRVASCVVEEQGERGERLCAVRGTPHDLGFPLRDWRDDETVRAARQTAFLPLRPVLLGGDDLTFLCDGRIALDLAAAALREFEAHEIPHLGHGGAGTTFSASAGVAIVKAHAPFGRSYDLAANLCAAGKRARQDAKRQSSVDSGCWLDWHVGATRPAETVEELRKREYQDGRLTMRPYPLVRFAGRKQSWAWLDTELIGPGTTVETEGHGFRGAAWWVGSRSRVKRLGSLVAEGPDSIERQVAAWNAIEGGVCLPANVANGGFVGSGTPLLDAIELLDLHVRLEPCSSAPVRAGEAAAREVAAR